MAYCCDAILASYALIPARFWREQSFFLQSAIESRIPGYAGNENAFGGHKLFQFAIVSVTWSDNLR
jgi:hypothetical protein